MKHMIRCKTVFTGMLLLSSLPAFAATNGALGRTSTGSAYISVTKPVHAEVRHASDFIVQAIANSEKSLAVKHSICIASSASSYRMRATGSGRNGSFSISNGSNTIPYQLNIASASLSLSRAVTASKNPRTSCNQTSLAINLAPSALKLISADNRLYSGILTLVIAPI